MAWTWNEIKELWNGIEKIEDLWDEEQHHGLAEVAQNPNHSKRHASKVAERVPNKHSRWIPAMEGHV